MLLVGYGNLNENILQEKYPDNFKVLKESSYDKSNRNWLIQYIQDIKKCLAEQKTDIVFVKYTMEVISCLQALNMEYTLVYSKTIDSVMLNNFNTLKCRKIVLEEQTLEEYLSKDYEWIKIEKQEEQKQKQEQKQEEQVESNLTTTEKTIPENKNHLTLQQLIDEDVEITEADVRDLKATQNKLKVGMLLQAKNSLNRILKLSNVLDKLYDKLVDRIEDSLDTTDTASLMYTTEYIAKALNDTNQFIVSLISNEKIQNFFIIETNNVINVSDERVDITKREKIRKAAEIVMNNLDYFTEGDLSKIQNPNVIEVEKTETTEEDINGNSTT